MTDENSYLVYILRCSDGSYYVGFTDDLEQRVALHNTGRAASHTAKRCSVILVYSESHATKVTAMHRERQLKGWTHAKKEALIAGDKAKLKQLGKRFSP